ncbi:MAG: phosphoglycerate kinase [Pelagibacteraceae bacterium]|nr:phosphoglycerate kinase [Pelagibacteraceae bacterium]|tara:strand:+ start:3449 stop:4645 length:1197 start_codon:yes stop_codon:yes gene_type:complete
MKNLNNFQIKNKQVLFRADLNIPLVEGKITDTARILAIKKSINKLLDQKNKIFILSHFGRPKGKINKKYSLKFICSTLEKILEVKKIHFLETFDSDSIRQKIIQVKFGEICLFENIRFNQGEENLDLSFAKEISSFFDVFVNDAFSASHRNHTSITGFPKYLPAVAGYNLISEIKKVNLILNNNRKPNIAIIGGSKISTKIKLLKNLIKIFNTIAIGGAMANTFLLAKNYKIGKSLVEKELIIVAKEIEKKAKICECNIILPVDAVCANNIRDKKNINNASIGDIQPDQMILDVGEDTTKLITKAILKSKMLLWNGPIGAFETEPFDRSTRTIAKTISINAKKLNLEAYAGGGDTLSAIKLANANDGFSYLSNAGGAFLEWLEGNQSPGVIALKENNF